jgi:hypothetical protein
VSNRVAVARELMELGARTSSFYLGLLRATETSGRGKPFDDSQAWDRLVRSHSQPLFPAQVWNRT